MWRQILIELGLKLGYKAAKGVYDYSKRPKPVESPEDKSQREWEQEQALRLFEKRFMWCWKYAPLAIGAIAIWGIFEGLSKGNVFLIIASPLNMLFAYVLRIKYPRED
ncbi:MAG: hypothetical protein EON58_06600 [Alphaproteobacteria bacterium]|nr:MAG: hypothetical protein EON58_06600 [Alphaproteobacteria bacterium]